MARFSPQSFYLLELKFISFFITGEIEDDPLHKRDYATIRRLWTSLLTQEEIIEAEEIVPCTSRYDYLILPLIASRLAVKFLDRVCCGCDGRELLAKEVDATTSPGSPEYDSVLCRWIDSYTQEVHCSANDSTRPYHEVLPFVSLAAMQVAYNFIDQFSSHVFWIGFADSGEGNRSLNR